MNATTNRPKRIMSAVVKARSQPAPAAIHCTMKTSATATTTANVTRSRSLNDENLITPS